MRNIALFSLLILLHQNLRSQPACVLNVCCCGAPEEVGIPNGGFEDPPIAPLNGRITFFAGETYSTWSVLGGSIDLLGPNYSNYTAGNPNGASQFIDLNGFTAGTIATTLTGLMPGSVYTIVLWYAINPGGSSANCIIQVAGGAWLNANWTATNYGNDIWLERCFTFTAQAASAELRFIGSSPMPTAGMLLDNMTMWKKCPMDNEPPMVAVPPDSPLNVECSDPVPPADPVFTDICSNSVTVQLAEQTIPQTCFYNIQRTWTADDGCGNTRTVTQLIQVRDTQAPEFTTPPADFILPCGEDYAPAFFSWLADHGGGAAADNCDTDVTWSHTYQQGPNGLCRATPVTFTVRDDCGNVTTAVANFIIEDTEPPAMLLEAQNDTVLCSNSANAQRITWLLTRGGALATDPCGPVTWTNNYSGPPGAPVLEVTFTATDGCMNSVSTTAFFYQPEITDTVYQTALTCDPQQAGMDTTLLVQGNCEFFTITTTTFVPGDTLYLTNAVCDSALVGSDTLYLTNLAGCDSIIITNTSLLPSDTTLLSSASCDTTQAGVFTQTLSNLYGCDSLVITTITFLPPDTTLLLGASCDTAQTGVFTQTFGNQFGCDSLVITTITFLPPDTTQLSGASCDAAQTGVFTQTLSNQFGCDSLVITTITFLPPDTTLLTGTSCDAAQTGIFTQTFGNQFGCDSLVITTITFLPPDTTLLTGTSCDMAQTGVFTQTFGNQFGCDSLVITTITLLPNDTTLLSGTSCDPAQTGTFIQNWSNQYGCDSTVITTVSLLPSDAVALTAFTCDPAAAGVFVQNLSNQFGCDSVVTQTVTLIPKDTTLLFDASCNPAGVGVFVQNLLNQNGCDSTVITTVVFSQSDTTLLNASSCDPAATGIFTQKLVTPEGCDSVVITTVSLLPSDAVNLSAATCDPAAAGVFIQNLTNRFGCDSIVTQTVALLPRDTTLLFDASCNPANVGVFTQNFVNQYGCDSTVITTVAFAQSDTTYLNDNTCDPAAAGVFAETLVTPEGCDSVIVTAVSLLPSDTVNLAASTCDPALAGVFTQTLSNQFGCDSIVFTEVVLLPANTVNLTVSTCDPAMAGVFIQNLDNQYGCDSIVTETVVLLPTDTTLLMQTTCDPAQTGSAVLVLNNQFGCDSVVITLTSLTPLPQASVTGSDFGGFGVSCAGETDGSASVSASGAGPFLFIWSNGESGQEITFLPAGNYTVTITDANGCTSTAGVTLDAPAPLQLTVSTSDPDCIGSQAGRIQIATGGGVSPYRYSIDGALFQTAPVFGNLAPGNYVITATDANGCTQLETATIHAPSQVQVSLGDDITIEMGDQVTLQAVVSIPADALASVVWSISDSSACPQCLSQIVLPLVSGIYVIRVAANNGCADADTVRVLVDRGRKIYVPNAFSPNDDGVNDILMIFSKPGAVRQVKSFQVFDRWGEAVFRQENFQPNDSGYGWNGVFRGQAMSPGVYVWVAEIEFVDGVTEVFGGDATVVR